MLCQSHQHSSPFSTSGWRGCSPGLAATSPELSTGSGRRTGTDIHKGRAGKLQVTAESLRLFAFPADTHTCAWDAL